MIRLRRALAVKRERVREFLEANEVLGDLCRENGWATATFLVPMAGGGNEFVTEYEYPDLATFQAEAEDLRAEYQVRRDVRSRAFTDFIQAKLSAYAGKGQSRAT